MASTRRLAAILAADVAGYSRLMGADEEGTHERLRAHLSEVVDPKIGEHRGRIVKNTGDGLLAEFASVVDALRCATEVQARMGERNSRIPADSRIEFRIGLHQGDVVIEKDDIFGDAVNVAARLEALAEPGGICVSGRVRGDAAGKLDLSFEDMGQQQLKNIARPVRVYALRPGAVADPPAASVTHAPLISQLAVAPRLSIVVLPFANLSNDPEQQYFADGITEDVTTDLSRIAGMFVISRNTAFTYRNKAVETKQIGRELGVRYALEGSVRRAGNQLRVSAQLIDATTDAHLWAQRFDCDIGDLFTLQNEVTSPLANALGVELIAAEAARPTENPDALDYILRGRSVLLNPRTPDTYRQAINLFERALELDPQSVEAQSRLATILVTRALIGMAASAGADLVRAKGLVDQALVASPRNALAHFVKGHVLIARQWEEALPEYETALALNPNLAAASIGLGWCKLCAGSIEEVIPFAEQAIRLSPRDPAINFCYHLIGIAHLLQSHTDEGIAWFGRARLGNPSLPLHHAWLASAYALKGESDSAAIELAEARRLSNDGRFSSLARLRPTVIGYFGVPKTRVLFEATYFAGLRKAGIPEE